MPHSFMYGDHKISYQLTENPSLRTKIRIHIHSDGIVEVETPPAKTPEDITKAIYKRARWISNRLNENSVVRANVLPRAYISGETHFYLGRRYQLKVSENNEAPSSVKLKGGHIQIILPIIDRTAIKRRLNVWYRDRALEYFQRRVESLSSNIPWIELAPTIKLFSMQKQWGSCSPKGALYLNPWLVRAPRECIEYVIIHEMCHLKEHNHSKKFYRLLDQQLPNWRHLKIKLDGMAELLLSE